MSMHRRLRRLEFTAQATAPSAPCRSCGGPTNWRSLKTERVACSVRVLRDGIGEPDVPDTCPACGRQLVIRVLHERQG